jgi:putative phage-type endonuclease
MSLNFHGKPIGGPAPPEIPWAEREKEWAERALARKGKQAPMERPFTPEGNTASQRTEEWFKMRLGRITASVAGACLGLHPYMSRAKAWRIIKGIEPETTNAHIERGLVKEAPAGRLYSALHDVSIEPVGFVVHPRLPWLGASPDAIVGPLGLLEIKCPVKLPEEVPSYHRVQCMVQMACTGRAWVDYFAWNGKDIFEVRIARDMDLEYGLLKSLAQFYAHYVEKNLQPPTTRRLKLGLPFIKG